MKIKTLQKSLSHNKFAVLIFVMTAFLISCDNRPEGVWSDHAGTPEDGWHSDQHLVFQPDSMITEDHKCDRLLLFIRYNQDTNLLSIPLSVTVESDGSSQCDTITIPLFNEDNKPVGRGNWKIFTVTDTLILISPITPGTEISISPIETDPVAKGIMNIGVTLLPKLKK